MAKFTEEDDNLLAELGIELEVKKKPSLSAKEERIIAGFEEIQKFVEEMVVNQPLHMTEIYLNVCMQRV